MAQYYERPYARPGDMLVVIHEAFPQGHDLGVIERLDCF
jgi:hypothetical protein